MVSMLVKKLILHIEYATDCHFSWNFFINMKLIKICKFARGTLLIKRSVICIMFARLNYFLISTKQVNITSHQAITMLNNHMYLNVICTFQSLLALLSLNMHCYESESNQNYKITGSYSQSANVWQSECNSFSTGIPSNGRPLLKQPASRQPLQNTTRHNENK